ncbi:MAG: hypothetical protein IPG50_25380 [Myxococcales bacterium]|nr:hypothetical protein [Myxococcales bacterium]
MNQTSPISRVELLEYIEITIAELKNIAQPHEISTFRELGFDAEEADGPDQLARIQEQVESLRGFCERRARSAIGMPAVLPTGRRQE